MTPSLMRAGLLSWLVCAVLGGSSTAQLAPNAHPAAVQVRMRNVMYHFTPRIVVHIRGLRGELDPRSDNAFPIFDDKNSFVLRIAGGEIGMPSASLANVLNDHVFAAHDAPLKDIKITIDKGKLKVRGKLHNKGDISFETEGALSVTADGKIRLHAEKVRALHLPVKGLMELLGIEISDLVKNGKVRGVMTEKDDILLDPENILPLPQIAGKVTQVRLEGDNIVQVFGDPRPAPPREPYQNYMEYRGNRLRFGKLTMQETDMVLIDMDPSDAFDFSLDEYQKQLSAGYTKITASFGLRVYMRDLNKLTRAAGKATPAATAKSKH